MSATHFKLRQKHHPKEMIYGELVVARAPCEVESELSLTREARTQSRERSWTPAGPTRAGSLCSRPRRGYETCVGGSYRLTRVLHPQRVFRVQLPILYLV